VGEGVGLENVVILLCFYVWWLVCGWYLIWEDCDVCVFIVFDFFGFLFVS